MSSWIHRVGAMFNHSASESPRPSSWPAHAAASVDAPAIVVAAEPAAAEDAPPLFEWLLGCGPLIDMSLRLNEQRLLVRLDAALVSEASREGLLPRAAAVIPPLLNSLRDDSQSADALAARVAKDPLLVAEVIRLANSAHNRRQAHAAAPAGDLPHAITRVGVEGLRRAIARVVLKPLFDAQADPLSARTAPKLWLHSEAQAAECTRLCKVAGLDPFEGYLAGLMHNIGRTAALRVMAREPGALPRHFSRTFVQAFEVRCEALFATLAQPWQLTESIGALAADVLAGTPLASRSPLAQALFAADRNASRQLIGASAPVAEAENETGKAVEAFA